MLILPAGEAKHKKSWHRNYKTAQLYDRGTSKEVSNKAVGNGIRLKAIEELMLTARHHSEKDYIAANKNKRQNKSYQFGVSRLPRPFNPTTFQPKIKVTISNAVKTNKAGISPMAWTTGNDKAVIKPPPTMGS